MESGYSGRREVSSTSASFCTRISDVTPVDCSDYHVAAYSTVMQSDTRFKLLNLFNSFYFQGYVMYPIIFCEGHTDFRYSVIF